MAHKYFDPVREVVEQELEARRIRVDICDFGNLTRRWKQLLAKKLLPNFIYPSVVCFENTTFYHYFMESADPAPTPVKQISKWDKWRSNTFKSIRISYMNWTYLPRWNGEEETVEDKLFRYGHFPMATQLFTYFAYRAASLVC